MEILVNGGKKQVSDGITVLGVLKELSYESPHLAVAVNHACVPRSQFESYEINEGDDIEILAPMSGG